MRNGKGGKHYKEHGKKEVCEIIEEEAWEIFQELINNACDEKKAFQSAMWQGFAIKHRERAGTKDGNSITQEGEKMVNYMHRAKTGKWIGE